MIWEYERMPLLEILSPAKINLFLHVTGRRPDGYHELLTLMCPINLFDSIRLSFDTRELQLCCTHPAVPEDKTNLAFRAAELFFQKIGRSGGVHIALEKRIPVAAGLGGGSSNAASVLLALNRYYGNPFSRDDLMAMGLSLGADVPFFFLEKPALASGIGERLKPVGGLPFYHVLLACPEFGVSTAEVYKNLNLELTKSKKENRNFFFEGKDFDGIRGFRNDLETVTAAQHPDILSVKASLLSQGATCALMSGSGAGVFGLFSDLESARRAFHRLTPGKNWRKFLVDLMV